MSDRTITRQQVIDATEALGLDPNRIKRIALASSGAIVTEYRFYEVDERPPARRVNAHETGYETYDYHLEVIDDE